MEIPESAIEVVAHKLLAEETSRPWDTWNEATHRYYRTHATELLIAALPHLLSIILHDSAAFIEGQREGALMMIEYAIDVGLISNTTDPEEIKHALMSELFVRK